MQRNHRQRVDVFWDFESARVSGRISGYSIAKVIREFASSYGLVRSFRVYLDVVKQQHPGFPALKWELHTSGISIMDCPSASRKDVADKAIIVDMLTLAMDEEPPHTILIATGDQHLSYALAVLRLRGFKIILVYPTGTQECLLMQSDESINWHHRILGRSSDRDYQDGPSLSSSSSPPCLPPSNHSNTPQNSYAAASLTNGVYSSIGVQSVQAGSRFRSATSRSHHIDSSPRLSSGTDARLCGSDESGVAGSTAAALRASPPPRTSPLLASPRRSRPIDVDSSRNGSPCTPSGTLNSNSRVRASTVSGGWFFPPPPSFPLDPPLADGPTPTLRDNKTETKAIHPPSTESFTIIDRPGPEPDFGEALAGIPTVTSGSVPPLRKTVKDPSPAVTPVVPDTVLPAARLLETSAVKSSTVSTPSRTSNHAGLSASVVPISPVMPTTLKCANGSNLTPATTRSQPTASGPGHPPPVTSPPGPTTKNSSLPVPLSSTLPISSGLSASPSTRPVPLKYRPLVQLLQQHRQTTWIDQNQLAGKIIKLKPTVYVDAGVRKWGQYVVSAVNAGIILKNGDLISLREEWLNSTINP